jgi:thiosulfate reductase/polysulfide reductase chain A
VEVVSPLATARINAKLTDFIHPEAVFMLHGFGKTVPAQTRCYLKGASDALLQENISDPVGGSPALDETLSGCGRFLETVVNNRRGGF